MSEHLSKFQGKEVTFVESMAVKEGIVCDVYTFDDDGSCDLGIVTVKAGAKTPLQKVLKGDQTIEGHISGSATLFIAASDGEKKELSYPDTTEPTSVQIGDILQWRAHEDLVFYEICYPPYEDGRYENLPEEGEE